MQGCSIGGSRDGYDGDQQGEQGDLVVAPVFFALWPEYAGDSLLPRLQKVIANTLALAPGTQLRAARIKS